MEEKKILLFESRDLCYESNQYFMECLKDAFEHKGYPAEICDLSIHMDEKLEQILGRQKQYLAAIDFNSLLPRLELEDGTPYLHALRIPFFNYLVDHPLYHHAGLKQGFPEYRVICIDRCHERYVKNCYPHIQKVYCLPLGAMRAGMERGQEQKRIPLLFLGTYECEDSLYEIIQEYPAEQKQEVCALIESMEADPMLTQEEALANYLKGRQIKMSREAFAQRLNQDYMADKYLRNARRKAAAIAAAKSGIPFTVIGHGWGQVKELAKRHIDIRSGVGFAASLQILANAKMLLNTTPGFQGGLHDRVYSAMLNRTLCFTDQNRFAQEHHMDGREVVLYDSGCLDSLTEHMLRMQESSEKAHQIIEWAFQKAQSEDTWDKRAEQILLFLGKTLPSVDKQEKNPV